MNKFPALALVSQLLKLVGWLGVALGILAVVLAFSGNLGDFGGLMGFVGGFVIGLILGTNGLIMVAAGESISVLIAIEENTRRLDVTTPKTNVATSSARRSLSDLAADDVRV
jgi:hypothetical protein